MTQQAATVVRRQIVVDAPIDRAFTVFTERFGDFKPAEHNLLGAPIAETVFEPRAGGHIYDRAVDGSECRWARVLVYEPPERVVFSWDISPQWQIEKDPDNTSEVEVRFIAETTQRTRVELEHRNIDGGQEVATLAPTRPGLGSSRRRRCRRRGMAAVPRPVRRPVRRGQLSVAYHCDCRCRPVSNRCVRLRH